MKDLNSVQDFEMGDNENPKPDLTPQINRYTDDVKSPMPMSPENKMPVDPSAPAPQQTFQASTQQPPVVQSPATNNFSSTPASPPPMKAPSKGNPVARKKAILGCLGAFGAVMIIFLIISFIFIGQSGSGTNPISDLLGINQAVFVNSLITLIHIIFILISLVVFVFTMVGLFRASMAKKDDKVTKKSGLKMSLISGFTLMFVLIIWAFVYIYLDSKRVEISPKFKDPIVTEPEETLNLSAPIEVRFDASNVPIDKQKYRIVSPNWDFGDGSTGSGQIVSHTYEEKGIFDVKLEVVVEDKNTGELSTGGEFHVRVSITNQALSAVIELDKQSGEAPLEVNFDGSKSADPDGSIKRYEWDLDGDGEFDDGQGAKVTYNFEKVGKYDVALRVTSSTGEFDVAEKQIDVIQAEDPLPVITVVDEPQQYTVGTSYLFKADDSSSPNGAIESYQWDFGDGSKVVKTRSASHSFSKEGTYEVSLKVIDEEKKEAQTVKIITIGSPKGIPKAKIVTTPLPGAKEVVLSGTAPFVVSFDASSSTDSDNNIIEYEWDFNSDGQTDKFGEKTSYTFQKAGSYTVNLTVTDADGNIGKTSTPVKVEQQGISASVKASTLEGTVPLTVEFDASASSYADGLITSYRWDFGDGTETKLGNAKITHKYTSIGTYTVKVTAVGSDNKTAEASINIAVREIPLSACFNTVFESGPAPLETTFDPSCSSGTITSYLWTFGDGSTSTAVKPTHRFENAGSYTVKLEVSDADNTVDKSELKIEVTE